MSSLTINIDAEAGDTAPLLRRRAKAELSNEKDRPDLNKNTTKAESLQDKLARLTGNQKILMEHLLLNKLIPDNVMKKGATLIDEIPVNIVSLVNKEGKTSLHVAIEKKYLEVCEALMTKSSPLLTKKDKKGETPLHYIVKGDFMEAFEAAMKYPPPNDVNTGDKQNYTPVHLAAMNNNTRMLQLLIDRGGRVSNMTHHKSTPLHFSAKKGFNDCVELIINALKDEDEKIELMNAVTKDKSTALMFAAAGGHSNCCLFLDRTDVNLQDKDGNTALHHACHKGFLSTVRVLVETLHAKISLKNRKGQSPLNNAASNRNEHCLTYLLEHVNVNEKPEKLLFAAVATQCKKSVAVLLSIPIVQESIDKKVSIKGDTVLHVSLRKENPMITRMLLEHGANRNIPNEQSEYPLHLAAQQRKLADDSDEHERLLMCKEILKESHGIVNKMNKEMFNPLFLAAKSGNEGMVHSLLQKGAKVIVENNELTAVHFAAKYGRNEIMISLLRSLDALQLTELSKRKPHPLHMAAQHGHLNCCKTLLKRCKLDMSQLLDNGGNFPIDLAVQHESHEVFRFLLHQMPFDGHLEEFGCNIHGYFKQAVAEKNESILDAIIDSEWACVIFDQLYCKQTDNQNKRCDSLVNLVEVLPRMATKALDQHITYKTDGSTVCNYTPFEFIYCKKSGWKKASPFVCKQAQTRSNPQENNSQLNRKGKLHSSNPQEPKRIVDVEATVVKKSSCHLDPQANDLCGTWWEKHHPLLDPSVAKCNEILNHKLTKSWMDIKVCTYTRKLFVAYVAVFALIALITTGLFSCFWNTYHLQARFNGVSRLDIASVYSEMYPSHEPDETVERLVSDIRGLSMADPNCSHYVVPTSQAMSLDLVPGSAAWNRTVCAVVQLEFYSVASFMAEFILFTTFLVFFFGNLYIWLKAKKIGMEWFHSTRYCLVLGLPLIFIPVSKCDFFLGLRPDVQWQFGVIAVLTTWLTTATAMNNVFSIFATITKHFIFNYFVTMLPVFLIMYGFALAFHLLLTVEGGAMTTIMDTISKTFLWILDEFDHKDIFRQDNPRLNFPATSKLLYVMYGIIVGGLLFNLILMNTGEHLRNMKRKVSLDRCKQAIQRVILVDALFPNLRRKYAKCHVTHVRECDHFNSQDGPLGINTSANFRLGPSSMSGGFFLPSNDTTGELEMATTVQLGRIMHDMETLKKNVRDILSKFEEKENSYMKRT